MNTKITKILLIALLVVFSIIRSNAQNVLANEVGLKVGEGYTTEGVYYEVYEIYKDENTSGYTTFNVQMSKTITRSVRFYSTSIIVPVNIVWSEKFDGLTYTGTLKHTGEYTVSYTGGFTDAHYSGTVYFYLNENFI